MVLFVDFALQKINTAKSHITLKDLFEILRNVLLFTPFVES